MYRRAREYFLNINITKLTFQLSGIFKNNIYLFFEIFIQCILIIFILLPDLLQFFYSFNFMFSLSLEKNQQKHRHWLKMAVGAQSSSEEPERPREARRGAAAWADESAEPAESQEQQQKRQTLWEDAF